MLPQCGQKFTQELYNALTNLIHESSEISYSKAF